MTARPVGQQGVSVEREEQVVRFSHHDFRSAFTVEWSLRDAREIVRLLTEAIDKPDASEEYVRPSGLVVHQGSGIIVP